MKLADALKNVSLIAFDTAPIIYFVEANPVYDALITSIFQRVADAEIIGITSVISLCEVLVHPIRNKNSGLRKRYYDILQNSPNFLPKALILQSPNVLPNFAPNTICERLTLCKLRPLWKTIATLFCVTIKI